MSTRGSALTAVLITVTLVGAGTWLCQNEPSPTPLTFDEASAGNDGEAPSPKASAPAGSRSLMMVYGVNNYGFIDVCGCKHKKIRQGSVTRRASFLTQLRAKSPDMLLVDGGNTVFGRDDRKAPEHEKTQLIEKAKVLIESYNRMGYQAMTMGQFDLSLGLDTLQELLKVADFPLVCANFVYKESGETVFPPFAELEVGGTKIGILGLTVNTLQPYYLDMLAPGTTVIDASEATGKYLPGLRDRNDLVVVLSQNSNDDNRKLAEAHPSIDFIVDPHFRLGSNKIWVDEEELVERAGNTTILRCDAQGARIGTVDLWLSGKGLPMVDRASGEDYTGKNSFAFQRFPIQPHFLEDPEIVKLVEAFRTSTHFVDTESLPPLPHKDRYLTASTCQACHAAQYEWWQGTKHSKAFASLEATGDQWRQDCIGCHVLGYGQTFLAPADAEPYKNVQCESCHGLNPEHPQDPAAHQWPTIQEMTCLVCHNKDQTLVDFQFHTMKRQVACPKMDR